MRLDLTGFAGCGNACLAASAVIDAPWRQGASGTDTEHL
jgi:hypothetical protein